MHGLFVFYKTNEVVYYYCDTDLWELIQQHNKSGSDTQVSVPTVNFMSLILITFYFRMEISYSAPSKPDAVSFSFSHQFWRR